MQRTAAAPLIPNCLSRFTCQIRGSRSWSIFGASVASITVISCATRWSRQEHDASRVDQIMAPHNTGQAFDSSPRFSQTPDRRDTGEVTVWKSFEDIKSRIHLEPRWKRIYLWL